MSVLSTHHRYYRTYTETGVIRNGTFSDTGVPVGTTDLIQRQKLSETELIQIQEYP